MDAKSALAEHITVTSSKMILNNIHYILCTLALWSIIPAPYHYYKLFYIATAIAVAATILFASLGAIRTDGLYKAIIPVLVYFLYLLITSLWAVYPAITVKQVLVDLIFLFIFALFYLVGVNNSLERIANIYILVAYPAAIAAYYYSGYDPRDLPVPGRIGLTGLHFLPFALPFCIWKLKTAGLPHGIVSFLLTIFLISIAQSRAAILIMAVIVPLTIIVLSKNLRSSMILMSKIGIVTLVLFAGSYSFEKPRTYINESIERFNVKSHDVGGEIRSEDWLRELHYEEGLKLLISMQPLGMGYHNFLGWSEKALGVETSMHSAYLSWGLEGGLICVVIAYYLLYRFYSILIKMAKAADNIREKTFYEALMLSMIGVLINGLFHQAHQTPTLFVLLGIAYSVPYRQKLNSSSS